MQSAPSIGLMQANARRRAPSPEASAPLVYSRSSSKAHDRDSSNTAMDVELSNFERLDTADSKANVTSTTWARPQLDPTSPDFDSTAWFQGLAELKNGDNPLYKPKRGGFFFRNLDVYGTLKRGDYLHTFTTAPLRPLRALTRLFGGDDSTQVKILHGFEGFVNDGEMLAVLGRPGSGCTTLLRTLAGETRGLSVAASSEVLYQGRLRAVRTTESNLNSDRLQESHPTRCTKSFAENASTPRNSTFTSPNSPCQRHCGSPPHRGHPSTFCRACPSLRTLTI